MNVPTPASLITLAFLYKSNGQLGGALYGNKQKSTVRAQIQPLDELFTLLASGVLLKNSDFGLENRIVVMTISTIPMRQNCSISVFLI